MPPPLATVDDGVRLTDEQWALIAPLLPPRPPHPLGCHRERVPDRRAMDSILLVMRARCRWDDLDATGICAHSPAHRRFQEWSGVFAVLKALRHRDLDDLAGGHWQGPARRVRESAGN